MVVVRGTGARVSPERKVFLPEPDPLIGSTAALADAPLLPRLSPASRLDHFHFSQSTAGWLVG